MEAGTNILVLNLSAVRTRRKAERNKGSEEGEGGGRGGNRG